MNAIDLLLKAERAIQSAKLLLTAEDGVGACNRAYYATPAVRLAGMAWRGVFSG